MSTNAYHGGLNLAPEHADDGNAQEDSFSDEQANAVEEEYESSEKLSGSDSDNDAVAK